jgi:hypothetical protein
MATLRPKQDKGVSLEVCCFLQWNYQRFCMLEFLDTYILVRWQTASGLTSPSKSLLATRWATSCEPPPASTLWQGIGRSCIPVLSTSSPIRHESSLGWGWRVSFFYELSSFLVHSSLVPEKIIPFCICYFYGPSSSLLSLLIGLIKHFIFNFSFSNYWFGSQMQPELGISLFSCFQMLYKRDRNVR